MRARLIPAAALAIGALAAAAPAAAQYAYSAYDHSSDVASVDEMVVAGRYRYNGPNTLSRPVSYRDLDLATYAGREALKMRVRMTARDICRELGESRHNGGPLMRSCEDDAVRSARSQVRYAVARAESRAAYASLY
jgi:UrcA family protein